MTDADVAAMQRLAAGDDLALNEIIARWQQRVGSFLLRMTGNHSTACDLAQETFVRLYQNSASYKAEGTFTAYLFRIAANLARTHHRWRTRHPAEPLDAIQKETEPVSESAAPDAALAQSETTHLVKLAVQQLPDDLREALVLFSYEEMSHADIAATLGCTAKAVETRIYRARQVLKERLSHLDGLTP